MVLGCYWVQGSARQAVRVYTRAVLAPAKNRETEPAIFASLGVSHI